MKKYQEKVTSIEHTLESNPAYKKEMTDLAFLTFIPIIAKYDTEVKKYLEEVNAVKMEYGPIFG